MPQGSAQFNIHRGLLVELSEEMRRLVYEDIEDIEEGMEETEKSPVLVDMGTSEETMAYFSEFCYTGDYSVDSEMWDHCRLKPDTTDQAAGDMEDQEKALAHARLYVFARRYNVKAAQELALSNLGEFIGRNTDRTSVIPCLVEYALENTPEAPTTTDKLLEFLAKCTAWVIRSRGPTWKQFHRLLASIDRKDFFAVFCKYIGQKAHTTRPW